jgi:hypothetical protein
VHSSKWSTRQTGEDFPLLGWPAYVWCEAILPPSAPTRLRCVCRASQHHSPHQYLSAIHQQTRDRMLLPERRLC